jgi:hypothetical protein
MRLRDRRVAGSQGLQARFLSCGLHHKKGEETKEAPPAGTLSVPITWGSDTKWIALSRKARSPVLAPRNPSGPFPWVSIKPPSDHALWRLPLCARSDSRVWWWAPDFAFLQDLDRRLAVDPVELVADLANVVVGARMPWLRAPER